MLTNYLERYYHDRFRIHCRHSITCRDVDTPVIVVRHPYDRVTSMYLFWKYGSDMFDVSPEESNQGTPEDSFDSFLDCISNSTVPRRKHIPNDLKFTTYSEWISPSDFYRTIVLMYSPDMTGPINGLLEHCDIASRGKRVPRLNVSTNSSMFPSQGPLTQTQKCRIDTIFRYDLDLWDSCVNRPHLFRCVIK
jgi:hypothetical protein